MEEQRGGVCGAGGFAAGLVDVADEDFGTFEGEGFGYARAET
jgi:hypothetical protein